MNNESMAEIDWRCLANGMKAALGKQECGTIILCMPETELKRAFFWCVAAGMGSRRGF